MSYTKLHTQSKDGSEFRTPQICKALHVSRQALYLWELRGRASFPRDYRGRRVVNQEQLKQIKKSLKKNGAGKWIFDGNE